MSDLFDEIYPSMKEWEEVNETLANNVESEDSPFSIFNEHISFSNDSSQIRQNEDSTNSSAPAPPKTGVSSKKKPKIDSNYQKNICAYVSKKIVLHLLDPNYSSQVKKLCRMSGCNYVAALQYYNQRSKEVFGIHHLTKMITPERQDEISMKKMFCAFLTWFLRNRYMCYMLRLGKMEDKQKYIEFKNQYLLYIVQIEEKYFKLI